MQWVSLLPDNKLNRQNRQVYLRVWVVLMDKGSEIGSTKTAGVDSWDSHCQVLGSDGQGSTIKLNLLHELVHSFQRPERKGRKGMISEHWALKCLQIIFYKYINIQTSDLAMTVLFRD